MSTTVKCYVKNIIEQNQTNKNTPFWGVFCYIQYSTVITAIYFSFNIDINGAVTGRDALTKAYLENPSKLNDKKADYARAKALK